MSLSDIRRWLSEPLVQFTLAGAVVFGAWRLVRRPPSDPRRIVLTKEFIDGLKTDAERRNGRALTSDELRGVVDRYVRDEVLYRQAIALGLDRGDLIVRRRLIEKMEFLTEDAAPPPEPTEVELTAWFQSHQSNYQEPARVSFEHVFFDPARHPNGGTESEGDAFPAGRTWTQRSQAEVAATFGDAFAERLFALPLSSGWSSPIRSSFGLHLVRVQEKIPARPTSFETARPQVRQAWLAAHRGDRSQTALDRLRASYVIEMPPLPGSTGTTASVAR